MPQRSVNIPALDEGRRHTFEAFLDERLDGLKADLLRECDRIAMARELKLKRQLGDAMRQNEDLHARLQNTSKAVANRTEPSVDTNISLEQSPEEPTQKSSVGHAKKSEGFTLWADFQDHVHPGEEGEEADDSGADWEALPDHDLQASAASKCTQRPNSKIVVFWEVLAIPLLFYDLLTIPMQVFHKLEGTLIDVIGWFLILYWTADILLRLLVIGQTTNDGRLQLDRKVFMRMYLRGSFAFDFSMVAPDWFTKFVGASGVRSVAVLRLFRILRLMRLMRMSKMKKIFRDFEDLFDSEYFSVGVSIVGNLLAILATCHYCACFYFWVGKMDVPGHPSWVDRYLQHERWESEYVMSLHWAIAQFTPGASRIQPQNYLEALASIVVLFCGLVFLSLFISALSQARMRLQSLTTKVDRDNWMLRRYLRQQRVSRDVTVRAMRYVEKCVEPMVVRVQRKDVVLLPLLSGPLQLEIQEEQYYTTLIAHPFLRNLRKRSISFATQLFIRAVVEIFLADSDVLFESGDIAHEMYFVSRGALAYKEHGNNAQGCELVNAGNWCSEAVLWVTWACLGSAKSFTESQVISIDSAKFRSAVVQHHTRFYIKRCAHGYHRDLNSLLQKGMAINDLTKISDDESSAYMQAIRGFCSSSQLDIEDTPKPLV